MKKLLISALCILLCIPLCSCTTKELYTENPTEDSETATEDFLNNVVETEFNQYIFYSSSYGDISPYDDIQKFVYAVSQGEEYYNEYAKSNEYPECSYNSNGTLSYERALSAVKSILSVPWIFVKDEFNSFFTDVRYGTYLDEPNRQFFTFSFIVDNRIYVFTYHFGKSIKDALVIYEEDIVLNDVTMGPHKFNIYKHKHFDYAGIFLEGDPRGTISITEGGLGLPYNMDIFEFKNFSEVYPEQENDSLAETLPKIN